MAGTKDIMIDLELLAVTFDANIIQIGAVQFNIHSLTQTQDQYKKLLIDIDPTKQDRRINAEQVQFWTNQETKPPALYGKANTSLKDALQQFDDWLPKGKIRLWANGHDYFIIQNAYHQLGIDDSKIPWRSFYNYRVIRDLFALKSYPDAKYERFGTYHNALDDAITQAVHLQKMVTKLPKELL
jgi:hypothetical protein